MPHCLDIPKIEAKYLNPKAEIPYGLTVGEVANAVGAVYKLINILNTQLFQLVQMRLEDLILGNSLSGIISELVVKSISDNSETMQRNVKVGGHPDLLPVGMYDSTSVQHGDHGIEIKSSIQKEGGKVTTQKTLGL